MVFGIIIVVIIFGFHLGMLIYKNGYRSGSLDAARDEAIAWIKAFEEVKAPNWQCLPVPHKTEERERQEMVNRLYVELFKTVKENIGQEMVDNRLAAINQEMSEIPDKN